MKRIPISLTELQHDRLRREALARHVSVATLVRDAIEQAYPDELKARRIAHERSMRAVGAFRDDKTDVSEHHDEYLAQAYLAELKGH